MTKSAPAKSIIASSARDTRSRVRADDVSTAVGSRAGYRFRERNPIMVEKTVADQDLDANMAMHDVGIDVEVYHAPGSGRDYIIICVGGL
jgi:hypothetical protein